MKNHVLYGGAIILMLVCECFVQTQKEMDTSAFWSNNFRVLSFITMCLWYYQTQKNDFGRVHILFLFSLLLPIIVSFSSYLLPEKIAILINISINTVIFSIWIYCFHALGAKISMRDVNNTLTKISPAFIVFPVFFYFFVLFQEISGIYAVIVLVYILVFSYMGILAAFLPCDEGKARYLVLGIALLIFANVINGYHTFVQRIVWAYPIVRIITVISKYTIIYGMIRYVEKKHLNLLKEV